MTRAETRAQSHSVYNSNDIYISTKFIISLEPVNAIMRELLTPEHSALNNRGVIEIRVGISVDNIQIYSLHHIYFFKYTRV